MLGLQNVDLTGAALHSASSSVHLKHAPEQPDLDRVGISTPLTQNLIVTNKPNGYCLEEKKEHPGNADKAGPCKALTCMLGVYLKDTAGQRHQQGVHIDSNNKE